MKRTAKTQPASSTREHSSPWHKASKLGEAGTRDQEPGTDGVSHDLQNLSLGPWGCNVGTVRQTGPGALPEPAQRAIHRYVTRACLPHNGYSKVLSS